MVINDLPIRFLRQGRVASARRTTALPNLVMLSRTRKWRLFTEPNISVRGLEIGHGLSPVFWRDADGDSAPYEKSIGVARTCRRPCRGTCAARLTLFR